jgi:hypothetical protein
MTILDDLIKRELPDNPTQRIAAFARDLAEGSLHDLWTPKFAVFSERFVETFWQSYKDFAPGETIAIDRYMTEKWKDKPPSAELLRAFGYFAEFDHSERRDRYTYILTDKAFQLLQQPIPTSIFISYSRKHFICIVAPSTLDSPYVRQEIKWAIDTGKRTIPIWHNGFRTSTDAELKDFLNSNAIIVENENVKAYNNAVLELLNYFGMTRV